MKGHRKDRGPGSGESLRRRTSGRLRTSSPTGGVSHRSPAARGLAALPAGHEVTRGGIGTTSGSRFIAVLLPQWIKVRVGFGKLRKRAVPLHGARQQGPGLVHVSELGCVARQVVADHCHLIETF